METPWCNYDKTTVVFAHLNESFAGKGMGQKAHDYAGMYLCSSCHDIYDRRHQPSEQFKQDEYFYLLRAYVKTIGRLIDKGILCEPRK
jgi:hypothetical protein